MSDPNWGNPTETIQVATTTNWGNAEQNQPIIEAAPQEEVPQEMVWGSSGNDAAWGGDKQASQDKNEESKVTTEKPLGEKIEEGQPGHEDMMYNDLDAAGKNSPGFNFASIDLWGAADTTYGDASQADWKATSKTLESSYNNNQSRGPQNNNWQWRQREGSEARQRGGFGGGGDRSASRPRTCFNCQEEGHMSRECTNEAKPGMGGRGQGDRSGGSRACFKCGEEGHKSFECPSAGNDAGRGGGGSRACFKCGEEGHISRECPSGGGAGGGSRACFKCGEEGHISRECPTAGDRGPMKCYNCQEEGHQSRDCTNEAKPRVMTCFNCNQEGHMSRECPQPRNENNRGRGRGGGRGDRDRSQFNRQDNEQPAQQDNDTAGAEGWGQAQGAQDWNVGETPAATDASAAGGWGAKEDVTEQPKTAAGGDQWNTSTKDQVMQPAIAASDPWANSAQAEPEQAVASGGWGEKPVADNTSNSFDNFSKVIPEKPKDDPWAVSATEIQQPVASGGWDSKPQAIEQKMNETPVPTNDPWAINPTDNDENKQPAQNAWGQTAEAVAPSTTNDAPAWGSTTDNNSSGPAWGGSGGGLGKSFDEYFNQPNNEGDSGMGSRGRGRGRGRGDNQGGGGSRACFKCGEEGHMSRECPSAGGGGGGSRACFKCGEEGHISRECPTAGGDRGPMKCYNCQGEGHMSRDCTEEAKPRTVTCFNCQEEGHMSRECTNEKKPRQGGGGGDRGPMTCYNCQGEGHQSRDCTEERKPRQGGGGGGDRGPMTCYNCQGEGHQSRDCTEERKPRQGGGGGGDRGPMTCFNCQEEGHMSRECTNERKPRQGGGGGGDRGPKTCFNCQEEGHMSRECTNEKKPRPPGPRVCFKCQSPDHKSYECPGGGRERNDFNNNQNDQNAGDANNDAGWANNNTTSADGWGAANESQDWNKVQSTDDAPAATSDGGAWGAKPSTPFKKEETVTGGAWDVPAQSNDKPVVDQWMTTSNEQEPTQQVSAGGWGETSQVDTKVQAKNEWGANSNSNETPQKAPPQATSQDPWAVVADDQPVEAVNEWGSTSPPKQQQNNNFKAHSPEQANQVASDPWAQIGSEQKEVQPTNQWGGDQSSEPVAQKAEANASDPWGAGASTDQPVAASDPWANAGDEQQPTAVAGGWGGGASDQNTGAAPAQNNSQPQASGGDAWASQGAVAAIGGAWGAVEETVAAPTGGGWGDGDQVPGEESKILEVVPEVDHFNGLHPCIIQICLTQSDRDMEESDEEIKGGYMSDDVNSQKTEHAIEYEKSDEQIEICDVDMKEDEKFSANFSEDVEDLVSQEDELGNFSEKSELDEDFIEQQSLLNDINRHLTERLERQINYHDEEFKFSTKLQFLSAKRTEKARVKVKREYVKMVEESVDHIQTQLESLSNQATNSNHVYSQSAASSTVKSEFVPMIKEFTIKHERRNIIVDLDRTFVDIMDLQQYQIKLKSQHTQIKSVFCDQGDMEEVNFNGFRFMVVIRKGTRQFFQALSKKYTLYVVSFICKDLLLQLLRIIDPLETAFANRTKRVKFYDPNREPKKSKDVLEEAYNQNDYIIIDRVEQLWLYEDQKKLLLIKTFAPLSGPVLTEESLGNLPIQVRKYLRPNKYTSSSQLPPQSPVFDGYGQQIAQLMPDILQMTEKQHIVLLEEAKTEIVLNRLQSALLGAYEAIINHPKDQGEVNVMMYFEEFSFKKLRGKTVSMAFYKEKEEIKEATMNDTVLALLEVLTERLGVQQQIIFDKKSSQPADIFILEEKLPENLNEKRRILRKRRDVMLFVKQQMRQNLALRAQQVSQQSEKDALSEALKAFVKQTWTTQDVFDYFFRSK